MLKQDIDLLQRERPAAIDLWLQSRVSFLLILFLSTIFGLVQYQSTTQSRQLKARLNALYQQQQTTTAALSELQSHSAALENKSSGVEEEEAAKSAHMLQLFDRYYGGFTLRLQQLADAHHPDLWLDHIEMDNAENSRLWLTGQCRRGASLPDYLARLSRQSALNSRALYQLATKEEDGKPLTFTISTYFREEKP